MGWLPLESNPEVLTPFARRLGLPADWGFTDVWGLDPELLAMMPRPCAALCLLFPSGDATRARRAEMRAKLGEQPEVPASLFFVHQHDGIGNACGTIACVHAVVNGARSGQYALSEGPLTEFVAACAEMGVAERGWELTRAKGIQKLSDDTAAAGETAGAGTDDAQGQHFIAFVPANGMLWELDGRFWTSQDGGTAAPYCHGPTDDFMADAARVIRDDFMARDPETVNFNITALCKLDEQ